jgi:peptidoglycan/LPS O-acetylase OafA/YrhL
MTTERDRGVDALRAVAILGVVLGHWLVTALVVDGGAVHVTSPLHAVPALAPASWLFQTLALFFFVGGLVATRRSGPGTAAGTAGRWLAARLSRLFRPVLVLLAVWSVLVTAAVLWQYVPAASPGVDQVMAAVRSHTVLKLVASPLWFLLVFAALTIAKPLVGRLHPGWPLVVVAAVDLGRFGLGAPAWIGWVNLAAGWLVPFCLGAAWSRGRFRSPASGWLMLLGGLSATLVLTHRFGYPVSMVGVPGQGISNLNPPTLAAVTFGVAQCGAALLLLPVLRRVLRRERPWRAVTAMNRSAMTIFLWHQTSLLTVTLLMPGPLAGLHTAPQGPSWLLARLVWLPVFAAMLVGYWKLFRGYERRAVTAGSGGAGGRRVRGQGEPGRQRAADVPRVRAGVAEVADPAHTPQRDRRHDRAQLPAGLGQHIPAVVVADETRSGSFCC